MRTNRNAIFSEINITPLTDIFLVLLIIMMVVAPMLDYPGLKLAVPTIGPDVDTKEEPKTVGVVIDASDRFTVNERPVGNLRELVGTIRDLSRENPEGVVIKAHPQASHNAMTQVMDAAQRAGVTKMAVMEYGGDNASIE